MARVAQALKRLPVVGDLVTPVRRAFADPRALRAQRSYGGAFLLNTMRKSGSHYLMSILANYLWRTVLDGDDRLDYLAMKNRIWNAAGADVAKLQAVTGYSTWRWEHENPLIRFNNARTIVHAYRNPLDAFVSRYAYLYVNRSDRGATIAEAIELDIPAYAWHYESVRAIGTRRNVHRVAYEDLIRATSDTCLAVLTHTSLPVDDDALAHAIDASSAAQVVADERRHGLEDANLVGHASSSFIRSGEIGEWRQTLDAAHVARIAEILAGRGISLDEFVLQ